MTIKLLRNLDTKRNKEQEDEFSQTMNPTLFFDANKTIEKIDGWKYSNIKKLIENIKFIKEIVIEYSKWNKNIELISSTIVIKNLNSYELTKDEKQIFIDRDLIKIHEWIEVNKNNKNKQFKALLLIVEITNNNYKILEVINSVVNNGISTISFALDFSIPLLLMKGKNE